MKTCVPSTLIGAALFVTAPIVTRAESFDFSPDLVVAEIQHVKSATQQLKDQKLEVYYWPDYHEDAYRARSMSQLIQQLKEWGPGVETWVGLEGLSGLDEAALKNQLATMILRTDTMTAVWKQQAKFVKFNRHPLATYKQLLQMLTALAKNPVGSPSQRFPFDAWDKLVRMIQGSYSQNLDMLYGGEKEATLHSPGRDVYKWLKKSPDIRFVRFFGIENKKDYEIGAAYTSIDNCGKLTQMTVPALAILNGLPTAFTQSSQFAPLEQALNDINDELLSWMKKVASLYPYDVFDEQHLEQKTLPPNLPQVVTQALEHNRDARSLDWLRNCQRLAKKRRGHHLRIVLIVGPNHLPYLQAHAAEENIYLLPLLQKK